jgi:hypothetical protein
MDSTWHRPISQGPRPVNIRWVPVRRVSRSQAAVSRIFEVCIPRKLQDILETHKPQALFQRGHTKKRVQERWWWIEASEHGVVCCW